MPPYDPTQMKQMQQRPPGGMAGMMRRGETAIPETKGPRPGGFPGGGMAGLAGPQGMARAMPEARMPPKGMPTPGRPGMPGMGMRPPRGRGLAGQLGNQAIAAGPPGQMQPPTGAPRLSPGGGPTAGPAPRWPMMAQQRLAQPAMFYDGGAVDSAKGSDNFRMKDRPGQRNYGK